MTLPWIPMVSRHEGPIYVAIADALAADISSGRLPEGSKLPTQRKLAEQLGIDFTTVSRAYSEAQARGLIEGRVGQGTFVRVRSHASPPRRSDALVDMSMNLPPSFSNPALKDRMWNEVQTIRSVSGDLLMHYQEPGGILEDRAAGAAWLSARLPDLDAERVLTTAGAQGAFHAVLGLLAEPGETICTEELTYPGLRSVAAHLRLSLAPVEMDAHGLQPDSFERVCVQRKPKALYCMPTLHNPTTRTMPFSRQQEIIAIARKHGVPIVEDDAYGALTSEAPAPLAALAPDLTYYIGSLSKCLSPSLRVAHLVVPDARVRLRAAGSIRASAAVVSPLTSAIATRWITSGVAEAVRQEIAAETARRLLLARDILQAGVEGAPGGFHVWLRLPEWWTRGELIARLRSVGIGVVTSDAFAVGQPTEAVRIGLGAPRTEEDLKRCLGIIADLLSQQPANTSIIV